MFAWQHILYIIMKLIFRMCRQGFLISGDWTCCFSLSSVTVSRGYAALLVKGYGASAVPGCTIPSSRPAHGSRLRSGRWRRWFQQPYHNLHDICCLQREHEWWGLSGEAGYHLKGDARYALARSRFGLKLWLLLICMKNDSLLLENYIFCKDTLKFIH